MVRWLSYNTGMDWNDSVDPGFDQLLLMLGVTLSEVGMPLRDAWWVGESNWRDYLCRDEECCSLSGQNLQNVRESTMSAELIFRGSSYDADLPSAMTLPSVSATKRSRARKVLRREVAQVGLLRFDEPTFESALRAWDVARSTQFGSRIETAESLGYLGATLANIYLRDAVMVSALTDREQANLPKSTELLLGSPEIAPPWDRLTRFEEILRQIAAVCVLNLATSPQQRSLSAAHLSEPSAQDGDSVRTASAAVLSILAWLEWCKGRGSKAGCYVDSALAVVPRYRLAELFDELLAEGVLCHWAKDPKTAWQQHGPNVA